MINQCDGCMSGADTKLSSFSGSLMHVDKLGRGFMFCVAEMYSAQETEQKQEINNGHDDA